MCEMGRGIEKVERGIEKVKQEWQKARGAPIEGTSLGRAPTSEEGP